MKTDNGPGPVSGIFACESCTGFFADAQNENIGAPLPEIRD